LTFRPNELVVIEMMIKVRACQSINGTNKSSLPRRLDYSVSTGLCR